MGISVADNFNYQATKPLDGRIEYATLSAMKAVADAVMYEGCLCYCKEDGKHYEWKSTNTVDPTTGKWREFSGGGGGSYSDFTGATASTAGAHGLVPAPSAGDNLKVLRGDGTWAELVTGYDWSSESAEGDIMSLTERPIGQWIDGKIKYQKVVECGSGGSNTGKTVAHGITNLDKFVSIRMITNKTSDQSANPVPTVNARDDFLRVSADATNINIKISDSWDYTASYVVLQYTKTTDSPLPSGVKFAGVTASGAVIYKKEVDLGSDVEITPTGWYTSNISKSGMSLVTSASSISSGGTYTPLMAAVDNGDYVRLKACRGDGNTSSARYITLCYTTT